MLGVRGGGTRRGRWVQKPNAWLAFVLTVIAQRAAIE
jgi:hypothetical protein